jgi:hypothetical protein
MAGFALPFFQQASSAPWYETIPTMSAQEEYERQLLAPFGGVSSREEFEQRKAQITNVTGGQGGPSGGGLISDAIENSKNRSLGENAKIFLGGALNPGKAIGTYYSEGISKYIQNGGIALVGIVLIAGAFFLMIRTGEK